ncbi:hypothetical protein Taro_043571 [Colocasia esculenta]|uniref:X8 domain-containing protein n=1 Tax=Colocasia esculenta TaxID=4460 RepID=A0A843WGS9_COLES|nr:hypothetical protein [Colocasia esculenta]
MAGARTPSSPLLPMLLMLGLVSFNLALGLIVSISSSFSLFAGGNVLLCEAQKTWCVAKPSTDEATLQQNIDFACSQVDCSVLRNGYPCSNPSTRINHASVAMNLYYQSKGRNYWNCYFKASGLVVQNDPSYDKCVYIWAFPEADFSVLSVAVDNKVVAVDSPCQISISGFWTEAPVDR